MDAGAGGVPSPAGPAMTSIDAADLAELVRDLAGLAGGGSFRVVVEAGGRRVELAAGPAESRPFLAERSGRNIDRRGVQRSGRTRRLQHRPGGMRSPSRGARRRRPRRWRTRHVNATRRPSGPVRPIQRPVRTRAGTPAAVPQEHRHTRRPHDGQGRRPAIGRPLPHRAEVVPSEKRRLSPLGRPGTQRPVGHF